MFLPMIAGSAGAGGNGGSGQVVGGNADIGVDIPYSLKLDSGLGQYLSSTITSSAVWTFSGWCKRSNLGVVAGLLGCSTSYIRFLASDALEAMTFTTTPKFRDGAAWYHVYASNNGLYVGGKFICSINTLAMANLCIGWDTYNTQFHGYLADVVFVDGSIVPPTSFGGFSLSTGAWVPKRYNGPYGAKGFHLDFSNAAALGNDSSGNGNHLTLNGGITAASQSIDTPTNNFNVNNILDTLSTGTITMCSMRAVAGVGVGTLGMMSGKWYWEASTNGIAGSAGVQGAVASVVSMPANKTFGFRFDADLGVLEYIDITGGGAWIQATTGLLSGPYFTYINSPTGGIILNSGSTSFAGVLPTGYSKLCTANLSNPAIANPGKYFAVDTYRGNGQSMIVRDNSGTPTTPLFEVPNSLLLDSGLTQCLTRTLSATPTDKSKFTFSAFVKRGKVGVLEALFGTVTDGLTYAATNQLQLYAGGGVQLTSSKSFGSQIDHHSVVYTQDGYTANVFVDNELVISGVFAGAGTAVSTSANPTGIAVSPDGKHAYGGSYGGSVVTAFSRQSNGVLTSIGTVACPNAYGVRVSPDGKFVYALSFSGLKIYIYSRNAVTGLLTPASSPATASSPVDISFSPDGTKAYVALYGNNTLGIYNVDTVTGALTLVTTKALSRQPYGVYVSPDGAFLYISSYASGVIDCFARDLVTGDIGASILNTTTIGAVYGMCISPDGNYAYSANYGNNTVSLFSRNKVTGALTIVSTTAGYAGAVYVTVSPDGTTCYVSCYAGNVIYQHSRDPATGKLGPIMTFNTGVLHQIGRMGNANYFDGYLSNVVFVDGQVLPPSAFGQLDAATLRWMPKQYTGAVGNNGFVLNFANSNALGADSSGNVNDFTLVGGITSSSQYLDTPTHDYCTFNPGNSNGTTTLSKGNLVLSSQSVNPFVAKGTIGVSTGKWYWEYTLISSACTVGVGNDAASTTAANPLPGADGNGWGYFVNGNKYNAGVGAAYGAAFAVGAVIGVKLDMDAHTVEFTKNGVSQGIAFTNVNGVVYPMVGNNNNAAVSVGLNCGQRPFAYAIPDGYLPLQSENIVAKSDFVPDLIWLRCRTIAGSNMVVDSVRGYNNAILTESTAIETAYPNLIEQVLDGGFVVGSETRGNSLGAGQVAWSWKKSALAGLNILTFTPTGANGSNFLVPHGLGVTPAMVIFRGRNYASGWGVYHKALANPLTDYLNLNTNAAVASAANAFAGTDNTNVGFLNNFAVMQNYNYVAYAFAEVPGFSKFGSYVGNGNVNGTFVYCGFKPKFVMIKRTDAAGDWVILDSARPGYNGQSSFLAANNTLVEGITNIVDLYSTGFKLRTNLGPNIAAQKCIFMAFAELPLKYATAS